MLNTDHLLRCVETLDAALGRLRAAEAGSIDYEIYRSAVVKNFELSLETAGKLLRRAVKVYAAQPRAVDAMAFKEVFREAARHTLLEPAEVERWIAYRDSRNDAAHDYGAAFAEQTLTLLPDFIADVRNLEPKLKSPDAS